MAKHLALYSKERDIYINGDTYYVLCEDFEIRTYSMSNMNYLKMHDKILNYDKESIKMIIVPHKDKKLLVLNKTKDNRYVAIDLFNDRQLYYIDRQNIIDNQKEYYNIEIINNKIHILYKVCDEPYDNNVIEKINQAKNFIIKQELIEEDNKLDIVCNLNGEVVVGNGDANRYINSTLIIPDFVDVIGHEVFNYNNSIRTVILGKNVKRIQYNAFISCKNLERVITNNKLEFIGRNAFEDCFKLKEITFNNKLKYIDSSAFSNCTSLSINKFPTSLEHIGYTTLTNCNIKIMNLEHTKITSLYIDTIMNNNLEIIKFPEHLKELEVTSDTFDLKNMDIKEITLPINYKQLKIKLNHLNVTIGLGEKLSENTILTLNSLGRSKTIYNVERILEWIAQNKRKIKVNKGYIIQ